MQVIRGVIFLKEVLLRQPEHKILQNAEKYFVVYERFVLTFDRSGV